MDQRAKGKALREACRGDLQRFCAAVPSGVGNKVQCLRAHRPDLSPRCRSFLAALRG